MTVSFLAALSRRNRQVRAQPRRPRVAGSASARLGARRRLATAARQALRSRVGSMVMQRRKLKPINHKTIQNAGGYITQSYFSAFNPPTAKGYIIKKASQPTYSVTNFPSTFNCDTGLQGAGFVVLGNRDFINPLFNLQQSPSPASNLTRSIFIERIQANVVYTNASSASCTIDLYDIACKVDNDITNALQAWRTGLAMETTSSTPDQMLGTKLWMSQKFKQFFKVVKTTHVNLAAGACHRHNITLTPNRVMNEQRVFENVNYAGLTYTTIAIVKGVPVCDDEVTPRLVSSAPIVIDEVWEINHKFRYVVDNDTDVFIQNNMISLVKPEVMNTFGSVPLAVTRTA